MLLCYRPAGHRLCGILPEQEDVEWARLAFLGSRMKWTLPGTRKGTFLIGRDLNILCILLNLAGEKF